MLEPQKCRCSPVLCHHCSHILSPSYYIQYILSLFLQNVVNVVFSQTNRYVYFLNIQKRLPHSFLSFVVMYCDFWDEHGQ